VTATAVVVRPRRAEETTVLAGTGAALWELLDAPHTLQELAAALAEHYAAAPETIESDLALTLAELQRRHVVRVLQ
jgi:hypothetical protein